MSYAPSTRRRRITKPYFRICSTHQSHSQAHFYLYAQRTIANRAECTFGLLRYLLGGDLPSQTTHLALFLTQIHGMRLEVKHHKAGISLMTSLGLATLGNDVSQLCYT